MAADSAILPFLDRAEAGRVLAAALSHHRGDRPVVLALPRGGVPVAAEVADALGAPLDVYVTRKVGCPGHAELAVGAIAECGMPVYDEVLLRRLGLSRADIADAEARELVELRRRVGVYRGERPLPELAGRTVLAIDDGLATGATARAAVRGLRRADPARLVFAAPVGAPDTVAALHGDADEVVVTATPAQFQAVGQWYTDFAQLSDADVLAVLAAHRVPGAEGRP